MCKEEMKKVCLEKPKIAKFSIRRKTLRKSHKLNHIKLVSIYFFLPLLQSYNFLLVFFSLSALPFRWPFS